MCRAVLVSIVHACGISLAFVSLALHADCCDDIILFKEDKLRQAREEIARQFGSPQGKAIRRSPSKTSPAKPSAQAKSEHIPTARKAGAQEEVTPEKKATKGLFQSSIDSELSTQVMGTAATAWKSNLPANVLANVSGREAPRRAAQETARHESTESGGRLENGKPLTGGHSMDKLKNGRSGGTSLSLFESMRDEAAESFVSRLGVDAGAHHTLSSRDCVPGATSESKNGNGASDLQNPAVSIQGNDVEVPTQQFQQRVLTPKLGLDNVPISSATVEGIRLDQDWEHTFSPPKYTRKMRREREAEILRQRMLLSDYNKMQLHLDSQYSRFQLAMKNEERQMNKWKDALGQVRLRVEKQAGLKSQSPGEELLEEARQAKWDDVSQRVDVCLQIIEQTGLDNDEQHLESVTAIEQHELLNSQVKELLQNPGPISTRPQVLPSAMPPGLVMPNAAAPPFDPREQMPYLDGLAHPFAGPVPYRLADGFGAPGMHAAEQLPSNGWDVQVPYWNGQELGNNQTPSQPPSRLRKSLLQAGIGMLLAMDPDGNCVVDALVSRVSHNLRSFMLPYCFSHHSAPYSICANSRDLNQS